MIKTTDQVTEEFNQLLKENGMALDVSALLAHSGIKFMVKVVYKVTPEMIEVTPGEEGTDDNGQPGDS